MDLSVIIPCYNEEGSIPLFYSEFCKAFKNSKIKYELIFINDGSKDKTLDELYKLLNEKSTNVKIIDFSRNFGKEAAMYAGLKESRGEFVSIIDADLQQDPKIILEMLDIINKDNEYDCVAAYQKERKESKILSFFKNCFYKIINKFSSVNFVKGASDFRLFKRNMVNAILELSEYNRFSKGIFSFVGFNTYYLPYEVKQRREGSSKWSFTKLFKYAIEGIVSFSLSPLKISFLLSLLLMFVCVVLLVASLIIGFKEFTSLILIIVFLSSLHFMCLGIMGEYLSKTYLEAKKRPVYIIKSITCSKK